MISNESIMGAKLIQFIPEKNKELILDKKFDIKVVIQENYIINIDTYEEMEMYTPNTEIVPYKKYILELYRIRVDLVLYTKALIAYEEFKKKNMPQDDSKMLEFKPKKNRDE